MQLKTAVLKADQSCFHLFSGSLTPKKRYSTMCAADKRHPGVAILVRQHLSAYQVELPEILVPWFHKGFVMAVKIFLRVIELKSLIFTVPFILSVRLFCTTLALMSPAKLLNFSFLLVILITIPDPSTPLLSVRSLVFAPLPLRLILISLLSVLPPVPLKFPLLLLMILWFLSLFLNLPPLCNFYGLNSWVTLLLFALFILTLSELNPLRLLCPRWLLSFTTT